MATSLRSKAYKKEEQMLNLENRNFIGQFHRVSRKSLKADKNGDIYRLIRKAT